MASPKRERQRENAAARRAQLEARQHKAQTRARYLRYGGLLAAAVVLATLFAWSNRGKDDKADKDVASETSSESSSESSKSEAAPVLEGRTITGDTPCPKADGSEARAGAFEKAAPMCIDPNKTYTAKISTTEGDYTAVLDAKSAPKTVNNFVVLARYHFYDGVIFHRIVTGFMNQTGDPLGNGTGGPGYEFADELPTGPSPYKAGALAMANSGPNTNGSQFFTMASDYDLSSDYSVFGQVTAGIDVVKKINALGSADGEGAPTKRVAINSITITES